jgi:hypothetical protein
MSQAFTMPVTPSRSPGAAPCVVAALLPIIAVVFIAFFVIGLALPVLPLHVHDGLGTFVVGLVAGAQFAASLLGGAESFIVTGAFSWGLALVGPQNTGQIMA